MATAVYLSNLSALTVNTVNLLDQCTSLTFTNTKESLEKTSFGSTSRVFTAGLFNNTLTMTLYNSFASGETYATLKNLVGVQTTVVATTVDGAVTTVFTLTDCYLESLPVVNGSLGELSTVDIVFTGGVYSVA